MDHTATLRRAYDLINAHDIDAFGEILADDFVEHEELPAGSPTREGVMDFFRMQIAAFPDLAMTVEDVVDGGDKLVARVRFTGTHEGDFMGMPATGRMSTCRSSTSCASATTASCTSTGACSTRWP